MELHIRNIAKIEKADIEINGITVIAGENNTGKSTIGKVLYCLYTAFHDLDEKILNQRRNSIREVLMEYGNFRKKIYYAMDNQPADDLDVFVNRLLASGAENMEKLLSDESEQLDEDSIRDIKDAINISDEKLKEIVIREIFEQEFENQIEPLYKNHEESTVEAIIKGHKISLNISQNYIIENELMLDKECIVIDNPFAVDAVDKWKDHFRELVMGQGNDFKHGTFLDSKLSRPFNKNKKDLIRKFRLEERLNNFKKHIIDIIEGDIVERDDEFVFHDNKLNKDLKLKNLSAGIKTFAILLKLLENGDIQDRSVLVLDEPEIHLHPSWQLKFAELLVLLQKEFNLNIVLATHSPYFMNALQVYSAKYAVADKTKYYLAELNEKGRAVFDDVTLDPERVYKLLARPFQILADEEEQG